jgi:hypothetical protein
VKALVLAAVLAAAPNPIQAENALPATPGWGARPETTDIEGYVDPASAAPGETLGFHVASKLGGARYRIEVYRLGWYGGGGARLVTCLPGCSDDRAAPPPSPPQVDPATGVFRAAWPQTDALPVPPDWVSGYYEARLRLTSGDEAGQFYSVYFVVREPALRQSAILVQVPVNTWQAYNNWGGKSLYDFNSDGGLRASRVSFDRPYAVGVPGAQATPLPWEIQLVRFLEREGYDVSYQTDADADRDPSSLLQHRLVMTAGHGEYWTAAMRDAFDSGRDHGTNLAFMGANNAYWRVAYEDGRRTIAGNKLPGDLFRDLQPPRPECQLVGVQFEGEFGRADYAVAPGALADPWLAGTGFDAAATLPDLVAPEHDQLPVPLPTGCVHPGLTVLFHADGPPPADAVRYTAPSGARVFASGTMQFAWGLDSYGTELFGHGPADPRLQRFMRNALDDLLRPAPPTSVTAVAGPGRVDVTVQRGADPRVREVVVVRSDGEGAGAVVCRVPGSPCRDAVRGHRTYRYAATIVDDWGQSMQVQSAPVTVPNAAPRVTLSGPRAARAGARLSYRARASDLDGDALVYSWRLDGRALPGRTSRLSLVVRRPGRHRVAVVVRDGQGGVTVGLVALRVRSKR